MAIRKPAKKKLPAKTWKKMRGRKGALHRALGYSENTTIPTPRIVAACRSRDPHIARMARNALVMMGKKNLIPKK